MSSQNIKKHFSQNGKIQPKLRMFANGNDEVSLIRSELASALGVKENTKLSPHLYRGLACKAVTKEESTTTKGAELDKLSTEAKVNVFIDLSAKKVAEKALKDHNIEYLRLGNLAVAQLTFEDVKSLSQADERDNRDDLIYVELGQSLKQPEARIESNPKLEQQVPLWPGIIKKTQERSDEVLIGIIDVGGFDFAHADFRYLEGNKTKTRFLNIWDMGNNDEDSTPPDKDGFRFGNEYTKEQMDLAIDLEKVYGLPPTKTLPQSQMIPGSHGTHVASIAAGNSGICNKSSIIGVLIDLPDGDLDRRKSFYDSTRIALAIEYLTDKAQELGKPIAINISLGTNGGAHDGSTPINRWMDYELTKRGRAICVAAGNTGSSIPTSPDDYGFMLSRIHSSDEFKDADTSKTLKWLIVGNTIADLSENEMEIWYDSQDRLSVKVTSPGGEVIGPIKVSEYVENKELKDGGFISIYNDLYSPGNGSNYIGIYLSPALVANDDAPIIGVPSGEWEVELFGEKIRSGKFYVWIERDDPRPKGKIGKREVWNFPSFLSEDKAKNKYKVNSLGCGHNVITVANYDIAHKKANQTTAPGPTRDDRFKPDIAAPGTNITAAKGFAGCEDKITMSGTSMASPYVTGVVGLLFTESPTLTAAQIIGVLRLTAQSPPDVERGWTSLLGYGVIDPVKCIEEVQAYMTTPRQDRTDDKF